MKKFVSQSESETFEIGVLIGNNLSHGGVAALYGDLGCGKTAITKGIASAFGASGVVSPTFTLVNEYNGEIPVYHFDAYRIDGNGWLDAGFDEYLFGGGVCIIEWANNLGDILPAEAVRVVIEKNLALGEDYREITVEGAGF